MDFSNEARFQMYINLCDYEYQRNNKCYTEVVLNLSSSSYSINKDDEIIIIKILEYYKNKNIKIEQFTSGSYGYYKTKFIIYEKK